VRRQGGDVEINPTPQEVPWQVPLDEDHEHATYDADQVATYFEAASRAALVLGEFRAAFSGSFDAGWWPGDPNHERAAFFAFAYPPPDGFADATLSPAAARWDAQLGEYVLDWKDIRESPDPHALALEFTRSAFRHACEVCEWDPALAATAEGVPPPIR